MLLPDVEKPLIAIVGPTAVGKTAASIPFAEKIGGEIISADSRLFYIGMNIGTAKPDEDEISRVKHHLIDVAEPDEQWSLAQYKKTVERVISEIHSRSKVPIMVGGTGQYVRALMEGWVIPRTEPDNRLREVLEEWGNELGFDELHQRLAVLDPLAASKIDYRNMRRTVRALEVIFRTGQRFSSQRRSVDVYYSTLMIGLKRPRNELYQRIDARIEKMIEDGLVDEVKNLLDRGFPADLPAFSAIGYKQIIQYLRGELTFVEVITGIKRQTRQFVRRQGNWFKEDDSRIHWVDMNSEDVIKQMVEIASKKNNWILPK